MDYKDNIAPLMNALFNESPSEAARKLGKERLNKIRELFHLPEIEWLPSRALVDYVGRSPAAFAFFKCWMALGRKRSHKDARNGLSDLDYFEYQIWFTVLDTEEIYLLCKVLGFGDCPNLGIPNRKKGAKAIAPILYEMKFGHEKEIQNKRSNDPAIARS